MRRALVHGGGVAALCCAQLLGRKGWRVTLRAPAAPAPAPTLVLNSVTADLINRVFDPPRDIFADAHRLTRRGVCWGDSGSDSGDDAPSLVIRGEVLNERLLAILKRRGAARIESAAARAEDEECVGVWNINASGAGTGAARRPTEFVRFGRREAILAEARLRDGADEQICWIETTPAGWIFLAPLGGGRALLQAVVARPAPDPAAALSRALGKARRIAALVSDVPGPARVFAASPGLLKSLCGPHWIAVGSLACAYDPLCGDGTGAAVREAILAAAVLDGVERGLPRDHCLEHYRARLTHALHAHLRACRSFYSAANFDDTWGAELRALDGGLRELDRQIVSRGELKYGLRGLDLTPLAQGTPHVDGAHGQTGRGATARAAE